MSTAQKPMRVAGDKAGISPNDLKFVQGDIIVGMAKKLENFIFFSIKDPQQFRAQLQALKPQITTADQAKEFRERIKNTSGLQSNNAINIAFSAKGLTALGANPKDINDESFRNGQLKSASALGDDVTKWDPIFSGKSNELKDGIHGVLIVVASDPTMLQSAMDNVNKTFRIGQQNASINMATPIEGHVRAPQEGHEHFGFKDGITQPMIDGLGDIVSDKMDSVAPVAPGVFLLGRTGDPNMGSRPQWALDGSFMAFRKLEQRVPEFHADMKTLAGGMGISADLLGARLVGRWKSGAPIQNTSVQNNSTTDPVKDGDTESTEATSQNIKFSIQDQKTCPFAAHIRKTNPREDLDKFPDGVAPHRILRRSIQFGPEVGPNETKTGTDPQKQRGLLFTCYQSSIKNGFEFIQNTWVSNPNFPPGANVAGGKSGVDPLLGAPNPRSQRSLVGANPAKLGETTDLQKMEWIVSRGGEYFLAPGMRAFDLPPFSS